jgi:hypothetical protein
MQETDAGRIRKRDRLLAWLLVWFTSKLIGKYYIAVFIGLMFGSALYDYVKFIYWISLCSVAIPILAIFTGFILLALGAQTYED